MIYNDYGFAEKNYYNTAFLYDEDTNKTYCPYCGKEINEVYDYDGYDKITYHHCVCEDANREHEIFKQIQELKAKISDLEAQYPKRKYTLKRKRVLEKID